MNRPAAKRIGVVIIDDDPLVRQALAQYVSSAPDLAVLGTGEDGSLAAELVQRLRPDVVLMDLRMAQTGGIEATAQLRRDHPDVRVLVLTALAETSQVGAAVAAGAAGFLHKTAKPAEVVNAIRLVARGHGVLPLEELNRHWGQPATSSGTPVELTQREREVLAAIARGLSNRDIAAELSLTESTVKMHVSSLLSKLGVTSRVQVLVRAHQLGLVSS